MISETEAVLQSGGEEVCESEKKLMEYNGMKDNYFTSRGDQH